MGMSIKTMLAVTLAAIGLVLGVVSEAMPLKGAEAGFAGQTGGSDTIIVKFKSNASEQAIAALNASQAVQHVEAIPALGLRVLRVPGGADAAAVAKKYAQNANVAFAEVNALVPPEVIPNDPNYGLAWHLAKIEAPTAWDSAKAPGVLVGVCDTGVEGSHPDLAPILRADLGWNAADGSNNWSPIVNHGTLVSGAVAAATNNATGVAGVGWGANVIPVRISNLTDGSAYVSDAAKCIQYSADSGARVVNLSYRMAGSSALDTAGAYARQRGAVTLVAAGNDGLAQAWTDFPNFLAIAATTSSDVRASYSNTGAFVDIAAPGSSIYTTRTGATYGPASGTSLASPVAAGVVALIFGASPGLSAAQAESILRQSADDLGAAGEDVEFGVGRVNARKAVALATGGAAPTPTPSATATPTNTATPTPTASATVAPPTATPTSTTPSPTPTLAPPTPTSTSTPTATPAPTRRLVTDIFKGKLNVKGSPTKTHTVTVSAEGPLDLTLSWTGKGKVTMAVMSASGTLTSQTVGPASLTVPAGTYTVIVTAASGTASYQVKATHY
jgi:thermitase